MAQKTVAQLQALWVTGYAPTQQDFSDLFESFLNFLTNNDRLSPDEKTYIPSPQDVYIQYIPNPYIKKVTAMCQISGSNVIISNNAYITTCIIVNASGSFNVFSALSNSLLSTLLFFAKIEFYSIIIDDNANLTAILTNSLIATNFVYVRNNAALQGFALLITPTCLHIDLTNCNYDVSFVNGMLTQANNLGGLNGVFKIEGGTNAAPTDGALNSDIVDLIAKGWTVTYN